TAFLIRTGYGLVHIQLIAALQSEPVPSPAPGSAVLLLGAAELPDAAVLFAIGPARIIGIKDHRLCQIIGVHKPAQFRHVDGPALNFRTACRSLLCEDEGFLALK